MLAEVNAVERVHFVEYGLVTLLFYRAWRTRGDVSSLLLPVLAGLIVGTVEEWLQWFLPVRVGEARDILLNLAAIACGLLFSLGLDPPPAFTPRFQPGSARLVSRLACAFVLVFALFFHAVHLGVEVQAEAIGSFKSRYDRATLTALARDRADRWRADPPTVLRRLSREDQYMDEGLWHIRRRNDAWTAGVFFIAWRENRILEEFFAPVLDAPSYVSKSGHRWPPEQRADAERRAAADSRPYLSDAEPPHGPEFVAAFCELAVGIFLVLGLCTRYAALGAAAVLGVAVYALQVVKGFGWTWNTGGYEFPVFWALLSCKPGNSTTVWPVLMRQD